LKAGSKQVRETLAALPDSPGVYLFYGVLGELLYVGKSKTIRTRVRSHFTAPDEGWLRRRVTRIEVRETAGELGALLLESRLIKELRPMFNVAAKRRRRIIIARRALNAQGYATIKLEPIDYLKLDPSMPVLGIFKHTTQAKEFLRSVARSHRLCPKLLRLENARKHCFSYHLGSCDGACMGEEPVEDYNARVETAFEERRIKAWPYDGGVVVEEVSGENGKRELFMIDQWCLVGGVVYDGNRRESGQHLQHRFDYDSYRILYGYLTDPHRSPSISVLPRNEFQQRLKGVAMK
jgi:DNA polymerase-3 subunit epsilon